VGEDDIHDRGRPVDERDQHVLGPVHALQGLIEERAEQADHQHALRGSEVPAVDGGTEDAARQNGAGLLGAGLRQRRAFGPPLPAGRDPPAELRLQQNENAGDQDKHGHDVLERS
jgi:hypothetical protein